MPTAGPRIVIIGLELGDGKLIEAWVRLGRLPYMAQLMRRGSFGWLNTTADQLHISAWPTIYTGVAPGEHGVYFTFQPAPGMQGYRRFHQGLYGKPSFWKLLDEAGLRTAVLDAPYTHPEDGYKGSFIYDWGTWAHYLSPGSRPASLLKNLESAVDPYPLGLEANDLGFEALDAHEIAAKLRLAIAAKTRATKWLLAHDSNDVVFSVFGETHVAGHYCWPVGARSEKQVVEYAPMREVYEALDDAIREIHQAAGPDCQLIVVSGDRVGPNFSGCHLLPDILASLGLLARPRVADKDDPRQQPNASGGFDLVKFVRDLMPVGLRKWIARQMPTSLRDKLAQRVDTADIDWSRTRAYCLPTDLEGCIRVNLSGREPQGVVKPGEEYEQVLAELTRELLAIRAPDDPAHAIVSEVLRTDQHFPGARRDWLPDLIVRWNPDRPIAGARSERIGVLQQPSPDARPGTHLGPGFLLACGPATAAGQIPGDANILDVAPTILARCGVDRPAYMPGRVLAQLIQGS